MVKLSIIIPTYNVEEYITQCLNSIVRYLTVDCQLIIVDDCSTDHTVEIIEHIINGNCRSQLVKLKENKGVSNARNVGLELAKGEYVAFIDGDDWVRANYVREILNVVDTKKDWYELSWCFINSPNATFIAGRLPRWNKSVWARVFNRSIIKVEFDIKHEWGEDGLFLRENIKEGMTCGYIYKTIYMYRNNRDGSLSVKYKGKK